jgi:hypothetical protein
MTFIESTLNTNPLCQAIVLFLLKNETAMDTARGIAAWWIRQDEVAVQAALDRLMSCGVVTAHTYSSGILYGLTRSPEIRVWLRDNYTAAPSRENKSPGDGAGG